MHSVGFLGVAVGRSAGRRRKHRALAATPEAAHMNGPATAEVTSPGTSRALALFRSLWGEAAGPPGRDQDQSGWGPESPAALAWAGFEKIINHCAKIIC